MVLPFINPMASVQMSIRGFFFFLKRGACLQVSLQDFWKERLTLILMPPEWKSGGSARVRAGKACFTSRGPTENDENPQPVESRWCYLGRVWVLKCLGPVNTSLSIFLSMVISKRRKDLSKKACEVLVHKK